MAKNKSNYDESSIDILKGLEPVQKRPGMYTNLEDPNHIIQEVVDNAQDEAMAGFASEISVELFEDGSICVEDNGRGIPTGKHPVEGIPVVEAIFTVLHAGGKFKKGEGETYGFTGGLHGVGVSVTNALSQRMEVVVCRDGYEHTLAFEDGLIVEPLKKKKLPKENKDKTGTKVRSWPNPKYFENPQIQTSKLESYLRSKAVLLKGTKVTWTHPNRPPMVWSFPEGLPQYLQEQMQGESEWLAPIFSLEKYHDGSVQGYDKGEGFEVALGWSEEGRSVKESYVNLIHTKDGGRHETGLRAGLLDAFRVVSERMGLVPKGIKIEAEDVWSSLSFILSVKLMDPQFQNQTKDKMTSEKGHRLVSSLLKDSLELWLNDHPQDAKNLIDMMVASAVRRSKQGSKAERKKSAGASVLPGKLSDCTTKDVKSAELFLVEGDSAAGSSKMGRDRITQAILPLRGKVLNTWDLDSYKAMASDSIFDISSAIGVEPHSIKQIQSVDMSKLRYGKIFIMADADVDGQHIQVLLLTLFFKHFPALITNGHIWIARAPLYRIDAPAKRGAKTGPRKIYALDEDELNATIAQLQKEGLNENQYSVARFKGLGEMNAEQLGETTMNVDSRRALKITIEDAQVAHKAFDKMMNSKNVKERREWMEKDGGSIEID